MVRAVLIYEEPWCSVDAQELLLFPLGRGAQTTPFFVSRIQPHAPSSPPDARQDVALRLQSKIQAVFPIHFDIAPQQPSGTSPTLPCRQTSRGFRSLTVERQVAAPNRLGSLFHFCVARGFVESYAIA